MPKTYYQEKRKQVENHYEHDLVCVKVEEEREGELLGLGELVVLGAK